MVPDLVRDVRQHAVLGFAQLLEVETSPPLSPRQCNCVQNNLRAGGHLMALTNALLDMASIEAGKLSVSPVPVDLPVLIQGCLRLVEVAATEHAVTVQPLRLDAGDWQVLAERLRVFRSCPLITPKDARSSLQMLAIARAMAALCA